MAKLCLKFRIFKGYELVGFRELSQSVIKIGKVPTAHVCLDDDSVSRMHAIVEVLDDTAHIIDLGSTRGTYVNGTKVNKAKLADGDQLQIGDVRLELALVDVSAPAVAKPVPPPLPVARPQAVATESFVAPDLETGARAVEVATMLGDTVVDVKHCMDPRGGKVTTKTWGFVAGGVACLLASATAFYISVDNAAKNRASLAYHTEVLKKPAYAHRPRELGAGVGVVAFGGLALGLFALTAGLVRARRERKSPYYRIGTAPGVEQPVDGAPSEAFPMIAPQGDDFVFNYGAGMDGEVIVDGKSLPFASLAATGLSRPSATVAGAIEVSIPAKAKIRARAGQTTFLVSAMAKPQAHAAAPLFDIERRTAAYVAGSFALHVGIVALLQTIPPDDAGANIDFSSLEAVATTSTSTQADDVPPEQNEVDDGGANGEPTAGARMALAEGAAGNPESANDNGKMSIKDRGETKQLAREHAIEQARNAGLLGSVSQLQGGIAALNGGADFESGFDNASFYGPLFGGEGEGRGNWGMGVHGWGPGGGCYGGDCGLVGAGRYGTIGNGDKAGDGWGPGGPGKGRWRKRDGLQPTVDISRPIPTDGLDRSIIKRYVKRALTKISYCYESELLAQPNLSGTVTVQFLITASGTVSMSRGSGMDTKVANCVAGVVQNIAFPKPTNGGSVQVNYPFTFRAAGR